MGDAQPEPGFSDRRKIVWAVILGSLLAVAGLAYAVVRSFLRFLLPHPVFEPSTVNTIGKSSDFTIGVSTKFLSQYRIYVIKNAERLFVMYARCTHLGCTPEWKESEKRFACPCHGSAFCMGSQFDGEGKNCAGPATRPLDRVHIQLGANGELVVDSSRLYQWQKGGENEFNRAGAYVEI